jgi:hypothetical protein
VPTSEHSFELGPTRIFRIDSDEVFFSTSIVALFHAQYLISLNRLTASWNELIAAGKIRYGSEIGAGEDDALGVGEEGALGAVEVPLSHTSLFFTLMHLNLYPGIVPIWPALKHFAPGLGSAAHKRLVLVKVELKIRSAVRDFFIGN